jgi:hypothetical protein
MRLVKRPRRLSRRSKERGERVAVCFFLVGRGSSNTVRSSRSLVISKKPDRVLHLNVADLSDIACARTEFIGPAAAKSEPLVYSAITLQMVAHPGNAWWGEAPRKTIRFSRSMSCPKNQTGCYT